MTVLVCIDTATLEVRRYDKGKLTHEGGLLQNINDGRPAIEQFRVNPDPRFERDAYERR